MSSLRRWAALAVFVLTGACERLPRDMRGTLDDVRGQTLRAGVVSERAPWVERRDGGAAGIEVELIERFAARLGARVSWTWGAEQRLIERLERRELHLVAAGLTDTSPWSKHVGMTQPYFESDEDWNRRERHVLAVPPGENAWLRQLERFLREERARVRAAHDRVQ
jgi:ABC-type amino acid transport substrate-binding protein